MREEGKEEREGQEKRKEREGQEREEDRERDASLHPFTQNN